MDSSIAFSGYENPDAFSLRYKVLERQQNHFDVSRLKLLLRTPSSWLIFSHKTLCNRQLQRNEFLLETVTNFAAEE